MMTTRTDHDGQHVQFCRFELRTTDVDSARAFYAALFGHDRAAIWLLHEQARARGAVPHWLGHLNVGDAARLDAVTSTFVTRGAMRLGPTFTTDDRGHFAVLRDPGGAIVALAAPPQPVTAPALDVGWRVLNTTNITLARANYGELFGWDIADVSTVGPHGPYHEFSYGADTHARVGALADIAGRLGVHAHWLYFFTTGSLSEAVETTRSAGGTALELPVARSGPRMAVCEDPQGAAFGLVERAA